MGERVQGNLNSLIVQRILIFFFYKNVCWIVDMHQIRDTPITSAGLVLRPVFLIHWYWLHAWTSSDPLFIFEPFALLVRHLLKCPFVLEPKKSTSFNPWHLHCLHTSVRKATLGLLCQAYWSKQWNKWNTCMSVLCVCSSEVDCLIKCNLDLIRLSIHGATALQKKI